MAEHSFQEVMRQWQRMCKAYTTDDESCCDGCPVVDLQEHGCGAIFEMDDRTDWQQYVDAITAWAAEHPEQVYPSFLEWLHKVLPNLNGQDDHGTILELIKTPIPADIAQKLGVEPK